MATKENVTQFKATELSGVQLWSECNKTSTELQLFETQAALLSKHGSTWTGSPAWSQSAGRGRRTEKKDQELSCLNRAVLWDTLHGHSYATAPPARSQLPEAQSDDHRDTVGRAWSHWPLTAPGGQGGDWALPTEIGKVTSQGAEPGPGHRHLQTQAVAPTCQVQTSPQGVKFRDLIFTSLLNFRAFNKTGVWQNTDTI